MSLRSFVYADLGRAGLGNMLFPWARCEAAASRYELPVLAPRWTQPKIGPLLRREKDLRYYVGLFDNKTYVHGLRKAALMLTGNHFPETQIENAIRLKSGRARASIFVFRGMEGDYEPLYAYRDFIGNRLHEILSPQIKRRFKEEAALLGDNFIGVHVRRGDKAPLEFGKPFPFRNWHSTLPLEWFVNCVRNIRREIGAKTAIKVFSDAAEADLRDLLAIENVSLARPNPSIVDILLLARSRVLVTTGSSSFSTWAAFLGGMPALWYPESTWSPTIRTWLGGDNMAAQSETDLMGDFSTGFAEILRSACGTKSGQRKAT